MTQEVAQQIADSLEAIQLTLICLTTLAWGIAVYFLSKEIPIWWHSFDKKRKEEEKVIGFGKKK